MNVVQRGQQPFRATQLTGSKTLWQKVGSSPRLFSLSLLFFLLVRPRSLRILSRSLLSLCVLLLFS